MKRYSHIIWLLCLSFATLTGQAQSFDSITVRNAVFCGEDSLYIAAFSQDPTFQIQWFDSNFNPLNITADSILVPQPVGTKNFYVRSFKAGPEYHYEVGPEDQTVGAATAVMPLSSGLVFNAIRDIRLDTVTVFPFDTGILTVRVDQIGGSNLFLSTYQINNQNPQLLNIGVDIPAGTNYRISASTSSGLTLFRNDSVAFPSTARDVNTTNPAPGVVDITGSTATGSNLYYFFYDWKITVKDPDTTSALHNVQAVVYDRNTIPIFPKNRFLCPNATDTLDATLDTSITHGHALYIWENTDTGAVYVVSGQGNYDLTVYFDTARSMNCVISDIIRVALTDSVILDTLQYAYTACNNSTGDSILAGVVRGTPPYNYVLRDEATGTAIDSGVLGSNGLYQAFQPFGTYTFEITDNAGCKRDTGNIVLTRPDSLEIAFDVLNTLNCNGLNDGIVEALVTGGTGAYTYLWTPADSNASGLVPDTSLQETLSIGTYGLRVTDENGCVTSDSITLTYSSAITPINHDGPQNVTLGNNSGIWSALVIYDEAELAPYYNTHELSSVSLYLNGLDSSLALVILRVRRGVVVNGSGPGARISSFGTKVFEKNITDSITNSEGFVCISLADISSPVPIVSGNYAIEIEVAPRSNLSPVIGIDNRPIKEGKGGWFISIDHPDGVQLTGLGIDSLTGNWNIRPTLTLNGTTGLPEGVVDGAALQSYPNPANGNNTITFNLPENREGVAIAIYDQLGREVSRLMNAEQLTQGQHQVDWNTSSLPTGIYWINLKTSGESLTTKIVIAR
jgi:hypothetical protein